MKRIFFVLSFLALLVSCGNKKKTPPVQMETNSTSNLTLSPSGVSEIQKIFDLYSRTGKMTLSMIRNIAHTSPELEKLFSRISVEETPGRTYTAEEFFAFLGESNRILRWARTYDLQTVNGWKSALLADFPDAHPEILKLATDLIDKAVLSPFWKGHDRRRFLALALKLGAAYNTLEAFQFSDGTLGMSLLQYAFLASVPEGAASALSPGSVNLLKLHVLLQYFLLDDYQGGPGFPSEEDILLVSRAHLDQYAARDQITEWLLKNFTVALKGTYPSLNFDVITKLYWVSKTRAWSKFPVGTVWDPQHKFMHPSSYDFISVDVSRGASGEAFENWNGLDVYDMSLGLCPDFRPSGVKISVWLPYLHGKLADPNFDLNSENFCATLSEFKP